ncbi:F0F1 ATP synthase subunit delta [Leucobacter sp. GX24907]
MGSASRVALAAARSSLGPLLGSKVGAELLQASAQIAGSPALLGAFADATAGREAKQQLVQRLFGSASESARTVLNAAVEQSWSTADELVEGIEELGLRADAIAHPGLADELLAAAGTVDGHHELELTLGSKLGDPAAKVALVQRLFTDKLSAVAVNVVGHLVAHPRGRRLSAALQESARVVADQNGRELATVTAAAPLSEAQLARLGALLEKSAGRPVSVTTVVDPDLVGGLRIQVGDNVIDGSIRSRLEDLRQQLAG